MPPIKVLASESTNSGTEKPIKQRKTRAPSKRKTQNTEIPANLSVPASIPLPTECQTSGVCESERENTQRGYGTTQRSLDKAFGIIGSAKIENIYEPHIINITNNVFADNSDTVIITKELFREFVKSATLRNLAEILDIQANDTENRRDNIMRRSNSF